ncbi:sodium-coupled neutral amino acid transporter 9 homolog [Elysia marginata]|uniref:Sodium-coupled neutral amino acid transporter 9 homolog n=1 Tax=Elysia marginata TaxID=1093978 RepID=A0AAV4FDT0_9GAST|nr:sodium-coupled neutral amino acid transporter 9 homolog [Elysia marginata]
MEKRVSRDESLDADEHSSLLGSSSVSRSSYGQYGPSPEQPNLQEDDPSLDVEFSGDFESTRSQSSVVTIFSMWNTMMGTSLLSMPWAIKQVRDK